MATRRLLPSVARWNENCLSAEVLRRHVPPGNWLFLRYEDFAAHPRAAIDRVLAFLGQDSPSPFVDEDAVVLGTNHNCCGAIPSGSAPARPDRSDDEWRRRMPRSRQLAVRALAWPLLLRYRYARIGATTEERPRRRSGCRCGRPRETRRVCAVRASDSFVRSRT